MNKKQMIKSYPWLEIDGSRATLLDLIPKGWHNLIIDMCDKIATKLDEHNIPREYYRVADVKEKWFMLSWFGYLSKDEYELCDYPMPDEIMKIVRDYEIKSKKVCMICGNTKDTREIICKECKSKVE